MMNKVLNSRWFLVIVSFFATLLLFYYVQGQTRTNNSSTSVTSSETVYNVPITVNMNQDEYTISGLPTTVNVRVDGPTSAVLLATTTNSFKVETPNIDELGAGKHTITLTATGLDTSVEATVLPATIDVVVEKKITIEKEITVRVSSETIFTNETIASATTSPSTVTIKGAESVIGQIETVMATVIIPENSTTDYTTTAQVQVFDANGKELKLTTAPERVQVRIPISAVSKVVPMQLSTTGAKDTYRYSVLVSGENTIRLLGTESVLATISAVPVEVNVSDVTESTNKTIKVVSPNQTIAIPSQVTVSIAVSNTNSINSSTSSATNNDSTSSSSTTSQSQ